MIVSSFQKTPEEPEGFIWIYKRVTQLADRLQIEFALLIRERHQIGDSNLTETSITLVGNVENKVCLILDDVIDGTHSFIDSCKHLKMCQAVKVYIVATHGILSGINQF